MTAGGCWLLAAALLVLPARRVLDRIRAAGTSVARHAADRTDGSDPLAVAAVLDLLAACLRSGMPVAGAAAAVAAVAPAPLGDSLRSAADLMTLGADAATAWREAAADPATEAVARIARRSARSGASLAGSIGELAEQQRSAAEDRAAARAERAGVLISGPLGLCFLPAFVCLGIAPVVLGLASHVLGGGLL